MHIATNPLAPGLTGELSEGAERTVRHQRSTGELSAFATPDLVAVRRESKFDGGTALRPAFVRDSEKIMSHLNLVRFLASKFKNRGEPLDDLVQVGTIGLIKAIDRFDPSRGLEFTTYATPTIMGEIKRHFRDKGWSVRVPRRLQELSAKVNQVTDELTNELSRSPSVDEIATRLGVSVDEVLEAMPATPRSSASSRSSRRVP